LNGASRWRVAAAATAATIEQRKQDRQASQRNQVLIKPARSAKFHAPDCRWVAGVIEGKPHTYKLVLANSIAASRPVSWCGGGR
jgi:hypothetical protein